MIIKVVFGLLVLQVAFAFSVKSVVLLEESPTNSSVINEDVDGDDATMTEALTSLLDGVDPLSWVQPQYLEEYQMLQGNNSKCCKCVKAAAKCITDHAVKHVKKTCKHAKPHFKEHCEYFKKHQERVKGMLIAHIRPHALGHAYCIGKGSCKKPGDETPTDPQDEELTRWQQLDSVMAPLMRDLVSTTEEDDDQNQVTFGDEPNLCRFCIRMTGKMVMKRVVRRLKKLCKKAEEPHKSWCKWAGKNRELVYGMLLVHVRPGEWGCGFCFGKGLCK